MTPHWVVDNIQSSTHDLPPQSIACTSGRYSQSVLADEFPHLDIINDLLDDDLGIGSDPIYQGFGNGSHHHLARHFSLPGDVGMSPDLSPRSSCRFDRTLSYHDNNNGFLHGYPGDMITQYGSPHNGQMEVMIPSHSHSQWQMVASDGSFSGMRTADGDLGYNPYHVPDYSNMACGVNGYTMFRPSNGL